MADVKFVIKTDNVEQTLEQTKDAIRVALKEIGLQAEAHAKNNITGKVPRYPSWYTPTGTLRNSITNDSDDKSVVIGTNLEYAIYNELGTGIHAEGGGGRSSPWRYIGSDGNVHETSGITALHFLRDAIQDHLDEYQQILADHLGKIT